MNPVHIAVGVIVVSVALIGTSRALQNNAASDDPEVIATRGIHWHPELKIFIRGEEVEIPANIGLIGGHNPMHTHDPDGIIHLEFEGVVREEDITLGKFFELWGKPFNSQQILEYRNTDDARVRMTVNGKSNSEYENYLLQHEDKIEIRYE